MTEIDQRDLIRRLAFALDVALPHLDRAAMREARQAVDLPLRPVTCQYRAEMAHGAVIEAFELLGIER